MLDISSISAIVAAAGVVVGVTLAYLEVRTLVKQRQTDLLMGIYSLKSGKEWWEAWEKVRDRKPVGYIDYRKKHGLVETNQMCSLFESVGILLKRKLVDIGIVQDLFGSDVKRLWEMFKPLIEDARKMFNIPDLYGSFEYLYNEMQKREQRLQQTQR